MLIKILICILRIKWAWNLGHGTVYKWFTAARDAFGQPMASADTADSSNTSQLKTCGFYKKD